MAWRLSDDLGIYEINERWYSTNIQDGIVKTENNSPELDSMTVIINNTEELDIKIRDIVGLNDHISDKDIYMIVATFDEELATSSNGTQTYKYTLNLISPTKLFETVVLPNTANTNIGQNVTIKEFLREKFDYYMSFQFDGIENSIPAFTWEFPDGLGDMICPEFVLGECTMRELLNYLWSIKNCAFKCEIRWLQQSIYVFVITYLDYNKRGKQLYTEDMIIKKTNTIENNATHLKSNLGQTIDEETVIEKAVMRPEGYIYNTNDLKLILNKKIYDLISFRICLKVKKYYARWTPTNDGPVYADGGSLVFEVKFDATNYIFEKKIFDTLPVMKPAGSSGNTSGWTYPCKNAACFWERGSNIIDGLLEPTSGWFGWSTDYALTYIIKRLGTPLESRKVSGREATWTTPPSGFGWSNDSGGVGGANTFYIESSIPGEVFFEVVYKSYNEQTNIIVEQSSPINSRKSILINNQNDILVKPEKFIVQSLEKVNQMGNQQKYFVGMTTNINRVPKISDYDGDYTVTNVNYKITNGIYEYTGWMAKNFINTALYTFMEKQKRYTALASQEEALQRDEVLPLIAKINLSQNSMSTPKNYSKKSRYVVTMMGFTSQTANNEYLIMPAKTLYAGNMIIYSMSFMDNVVGGRYKGDNTISGTNTFPMKDLKYVDSNGEFKGVKCTWYEGLILEHYSGDNAYEHIIESLERLPERCSYMTDGLESDPLAHDDGGYNPIFYNTFKFKKDNREKITLTAEIIFKTDNNNIIIGNNFSKFFTADKIAIYKRSRVFTYLDQIVNTSECIAATAEDFGIFETPTPTQIKDVIAGVGYNNLSWSGLRGNNIAFVGPDNELLFAINNYNGEYIRFGDPNIWFNKPDFYIDIKNPIIEQIVDRHQELYYFKITSTNIETVEYTYYAVDEDGQTVDVNTWEYYDEGEGEIAPNETIIAGPYNFNTNYKIKVRFNNYGLHTKYIYSDGTQSDY